MGHARVDNARRRHRRRIAVVTGTRAEYGLLQSTMREIQAHPRLELQLVVTGMHLLRKFGSTVRQIECDGWNIAARIPMQSGSDDALDQSKGLARGVQGIAGFLQDARTDLVLVLGDRIEALAGALAALTTGRLIGHIHGGDVATGDLDESIRHAITKLAHIHFAATRSAARRIVRMGEPPQRVHWVGAPGLDRLRQLIAPDAVERRPARTDRCLVLHHPIGRSPDDEHKTMLRILNAVERSGKNRIIIYPNSDRGHQGVIRAIESHVRTGVNGDVRVVRSMDRDSFLRTMMECDALIGNSSSGIIEAATAGTPAVNVGPRQDGRERSGAAVIDCGESTAEIHDALATALRKRPRMGGPSVYGDGTAGSRIARVLADQLDKLTRQKRLSY